MKKYILMSVIAGMLPVIGARAECEATTKTYTACKPGYYLSGGNCLECPSSGGIKGTSADKNNIGITACYIPAGTAFSDSGGSGTYTGDCYYSN